MLLLLNRLMRFLVLKATTPTLSHKYWRSTLMEPMKRQIFRFAERTTSSAIRNMWNKLRGHCFQTWATRIADSLHIWMHQTSKRSSIYLAISKINIYICNSSFVLHTLFAHLFCDEKCTTNKYENNHQLDVIYLLNTFAQTVARKCGVSSVWPFDRTKLW